MTILVNVVVFAVLCLLILVVLPTLLARCIAILLPIAFPSLTLINIAKLSLLPTYCKDLHAIYQLGSTLISIQFKELRIVLRLFDDTSGLCHIDIYGLHISITGLRFPDVMASSPSDKSESLNSEVKKVLARLISFQLCEISFDIKMADTKDIAIQGVADKMSITTSRSVESSSHVLINTLIQNGSLMITEEDQLVFSYEGQLASADIHYQVFSRRMIVDLNTQGAVYISQLHRSESLLGMDTVEVTIEPFLAFYTRYQQEEDDALELKMVYTSDVSGKLMKLRMHAERMLVITNDFRVSQPMVQELEDVTYLQHYSFLPNSPNLCRTLQVILGFVKWRGCDAILTKVNLKKQLFVMNEIDFVDQEIADGSCAFAVSYGSCCLQTQLILKQSFVAIDEWLLRWACVMSDVNDCLPTSRFAHIKRATLNGTCDFFLFSVCPMSQCSSENRLVTYEYHSMLVRRSLAAFSEVSRYTLTASKLIVRTELSLSELELEATVKMMPKDATVSVEDAKCGFVWEQDHLKVNFESGAAFEIKSVHLQRFQADVMTTLQQQRFPFFEIDSMDVDFITQWKLDFRLGTIRSSMTSTRIAIFSITLDQVLRSVSRLTDLLRLVKRLKYNVIENPSVQHTDLQVTTKDLNLKITPNSSFHEAISLTSSSFRYSSSSSFSEYMLETGAMAFSLDEGSQEISSFNMMTYRINKDTGKLGIEFTLVGLRCIIINRSTFGALMNGLSSFVNDYNIISVNPKATTIIPPTHYKFRCDVLDLAICSSTDKNHLTTIARIRVSELIANYDCTASPSQAILDISKMDHPERVDYHQPSGGRLRLSCASVRLLSTVFGMDILAIEKTNANGLLYFASLKHTAVHETTSFHSTPSDLAGDYECFVPTISRSAPRKLYGDVLIAIDKIRTSLSDVSDECFQESAAILNEAFKSDDAQSDSPDDKLTSWDTLRYWFHGSLSVVCSSIQMKYATATTLSNGSDNPLMQMRFSLEQLKMIASGSSLELRSYNLIVNLRQKKLSGVEPLDMIVIPGACSSSHK